VKVKNSTAPAVKRKPERIRVMSPSRGFRLDEHTVL